MTKKEIGRVVVRAKRGHRMSYYKIHKLSGVQRPVVKSIEKGEASYTVDSLLDVCKALGITIHTEFNGCKSVGSGLPVT